MGAEPSNWKLLERLGAGGMGEVFLAETPEHKKVAVKTLSSLQSSQVELFAGEAQLLLKLRHPSIAAVLGYAVDSTPIFGEARGPCFWMEYVAGQGMLDAAKRAEPQEIFRWLHDSLEALQALHAQSISHGDLSPHNVLVTSQGQVKLLDFGLAGRFDAPAKLTAGTLPYLAPERISGKNLPASDLFSLGTIFFEALTGRHPRAECRSLQEMVRAPAPALLEVAPQLAERFAVPARVIDRLIQIDLSHRFAGAAEALEALRGVQTSTARLAAEYYSAEMLGTEAAFRKVEAAVAKLAEKSAILWVHGITGVGKRRFLREVEFRCAVQGLKIHEVTGPNFHSTLAQLRNSPAETSQVFLFRSLEELEPNELAPMLALRRGGLPPRRVLLIFAWNEDRLSEATRRFLNGFLGMPDSQDLPFKNLDRANTEHLLEGALGKELAKEIVAALFAQTSGNPQLLLQMIALLREQHISDKKYVSQDWLQTLGRLHSFADILLYRLLGLGAEELRLLSLLAVAHEPVGLGSLELVWAKTYSGEAQLSGLNALLLRLAGREFVTQDPESGLFRLSLPALEAALLKKIPDLERLHRVWLEVLASEPTPSPQFLHHALFLRDEPKVAASARPAVESLRARRRRVEAVEQVDRALTLIQDPVEKSRLLRLKNNLCIELNRFADVLASCEQIFALAAADESLALKTAKYWVVSGIACQKLARLEEARSRFQSCLEFGATCSDPEVIPFIVRAHSLLGMEERQSGNLVLARSHFEQALSLSPGQDRRRAEVCRNLAAVLTETGDWSQAATLTEEAKRLYREAGYISGEFQTLLQEGNLALERDEAARAAAAYAEAEALAQRHEEELSLGTVWNNQGVLARKEGRLETALRLLGQAEAVFRSLSDDVDLIDNLGQLAIAEAAVGRFVKAQARIAELSAKAGAFPRAAELAAQAESWLRELRDGELAPLEKSPPDPARLASFWNRESAIRWLLRRDPEATELKEILNKIYRDLPVTLQVSFVERWDYQRCVEHKFRNTSPPPSKGRTPMQILESLSAITRELLREDDMDRVLKHLMDAAMRLSSAENGFLVLRSESQEGPIPGFSVVVAQNVSKQVLESEEFAFSLSAIRQAMESGQPVVTDNALIDPRFSQAKSVQLHELKSILALPVNGRRGALGVFYLDHRFEAGLFGDEKLAALQAFADQAALALQKGQMIEELKKANAHLTGQVEEQSDQMHRMQMELAESRLKLKYEYSEIVGRSPKMIEVLALVDKITDSRISVWIFGESGTGKESIARALHFNSARGKFPFVTENCSALPETLMESELFGHKKGAFTHADRDKKGILEYADKGTIFLDEIADLSLNLQAKLLRFLQEGEIRPLGSNQMIKVDVRVVSASNKDLHELVGQGKFREDLYFRLNGVTVTLPPLRERMEDLPILVEHFLKKFSQQEGKEPCRLSMEVLRQFMNYPWPGNIRELQNTLETAALFAEHGAIGLKALAFKPILLGKKKAMQNIMLKTVAREAMDPELEKMLLAIRDNGYHKGHAAKALGISRRNLYTKLEKFEVPVELKGLKAFIDEKFI